MRSPSSFLFWFIVIALTAAFTQAAREFGAWTRAVPPAAGRTIPGAAMSGTVSGYARVVDGDSLEIAGERIRLFGIDAPERYQSCRDRTGRDYRCGRVAARALHSSVAGRIVTCTPVDHDRYGRDVALCRADGRDLGEAMVRAGQALDYAQHSRGRYVAAEREASAAKRGIWAGTFELPAEWRRRHAR